MTLGDHVFIYHSHCKPTAVVGVADTVTSSSAYDMKATRESPRWYCVDIRLRQRFTQVLTLAQIKAAAPLVNIALLKQGRLSVAPATFAEADVILDHCQARRDKELRTPRS